jgi:hypothetical protein
MKVDGIIKRWHGQPNFTAGVAETHERDQESRERDREITRLAWADELYGGNQASHWALDLTRRAITLRNRQRSRS